MENLNVKRTDLMFYKHIYKVIKDIKEIYPKSNGKMLIFEDHLTGEIYLTKTLPSTYCEICGDCDREIGFIDMDTGLKELQKKIYKLEELRHHLLRLNNAPGWATTENIFNSLNIKYPKKYKGNCPNNIKCKIPIFATIEEFNNVIENKDIPIECKACGIKDALYYLE